MATEMKLAPIDTAELFDRIAALPPDAIVEALKAFAEAMGGAERDDRGNLIIPTDTAEMIVNELNAACARRDAPYSTKH